eukprot:gnl/TRDRNA2_/TRDRNA2_126620_c2_seq1.p2 gnl/TRDRNA2_/TRDRNA2_126620_c2~~gnl/TRDRNA2_/TRDRNA2_126620_c2_seq1.p2  ORF type:complete len:109 (+),score=16.41 gnl/TRDRNA2_/TRDRNA2_126620_c2_seq1:510-836(+)
MWASSVEYARRLAPAQRTATFVALTNGIYYRLALGCGSLAWGFLTKEPPHGFGFRPVFRAASATLLLWSVVWNCGWASTRRCATAASASVGSEAAGIALRDATDEGES